MPRPNTVSAVLLLVALLAGPASAYVEERYTLCRWINESTNIVLMKVEKVNKERKLLYFTKVADLKGKHPADTIKQNLGVGGFNPKENALPVEWAEPGKLAIFFHNGSASETCIGKYWYQCYPGGEWWNHSHGEPYVARTYCGDVEVLKDAVEKILKGEAAVIPCTVSKTDLRIQKVKADPKEPNAYTVVEAPAIERLPLTGVAGFSEMIELPRPEGAVQGAIAADVDADGFPDVLVVASGGLRLLRNTGKGGFEDATDKWGLAGDKGALTAAFADYEGSGRPSLLTSAGRLYTNLGDKFRDDTARLPATPKRVSNPGEAAAWIDIDADGRPDIVCSVGVRGLAAFRNLGGPEKWFEDVSDKAGLGEAGLGAAPANYLTAADLDGDGRTDFVLNLSEPLVALNRNGVFTAAADTGIRFPALARPALAAADFRNDGRPGLLVTAAHRAGAITEWKMIGTFSADEDKALAADGGFSPAAKPTVTLGEASWTWKTIRSRTGGALAVGRAQPSPNACYAFAEFDWPQSGTAVLWFGSENGLTAWLNGKEVYGFQGKRAYSADADRVEVSLKAGRNAVLLKVFDDGAVWRTCVRAAPAGLFPPAAVHLFARDDAGKYVDVTADAGDLALLREDCVSAAWGDLDNDGLADLIITGRTGLVRVYLNKGGGKFRYATPELGLEQKFKAAAAVVADFNRDGIADLLLVGADADPTVVLTGRLKGKFAPLTVRFAGPDCAVGAAVRLTDAAGRLMGTARISGGDGRAMQSAAEARFAVPPGSYKIEVRYSSGKVAAKDVTVADKPAWEAVGGK
jgi:hypothetical protein